MEWVGRVIDGRYVVEGVVGSGGMGVVLAARHKFTGARVALKMVRKDLGVDPEISARFLAEARVPAAIDHRGVVKTLDAGQTPEGELYLVMELLSGRSLRQEIQTSSPPLVATRRIGMELLDVLAAAHARGMIHRDVKPENIFLVSSGPEVNSGPSIWGAGPQVKLLDFGITKLLTSGHSVLPRTQAGAMLGTAAYMAPEQLADARTVDARADLWAVGILLYELIGGRRPFRGATIEELLVQLVRGEPDPIRAAYPQATPDLEAFFARALAKDPQQRFASAGEMAQAFARLSLWPPLPNIGAAPSPMGGVPLATPPVGVPGLAPQTPPAGVPGLSTQATELPRAMGGATPPQALPLVDGRATPPQALPMYGRIKTPTAQTPGAPTPLPTPLPYTSTGAPRNHPSTRQNPAVGALQTGSMAGSTDQLRHVGGKPWLLVFAGALAVIAGASVVFFAMKRSQSTTNPTPQVAAAGPTTAANAANTANATNASPTPSGSSTSPPATGTNLVTAGTATKTPKTVAHGSTGPAPVDPYAPSAGTTSPRQPAQPQPSTQPQQQPAAAVVPSGDTFCETSCKMLDSCHLGSRSCESDCARNPSIHQCLVNANGNCNAFAGCMFAGYCSKLPQGTHSCSEAMDCETSCGGNQVCVCTCIQGLAPDRAAALLGLRGCAAPCRGNTACIEKNCDAQVRRCRAQ